MTAPHDPAVTDPAGLIAGLVAEAGPGLAREQVQAAVASVSGGRAKSRRLALALAGRPGVLADGRSPAPRAVGDLLVALHDAGATGISLPACAQCGRKTRCFLRAGQDWYCPACAPAHREPCAACGENRTVASLDRAGRPRCSKCPDTDDRDPAAVIHGIITALDPGAGRETVAGAVRRSAPQPAYQRRLAWALEENPALLTGDAHLAPLRAIVRLAEMLDDAGVAGVVRPACGHCGRTVRIDKPLDGVRACRRCHARSRAVPCGHCGAVRDPVTRDEQGRPVCANCFTAAPENLEACTGCGRVRPVGRRTPDGPLCACCPDLPVMTCSVCGKRSPCGTSRATGKPWCPDCQRRRAACSACGRHGAIASGTLDQPVCAGCTPPPPWAGCPVCSDPDHPSPGQCGRCLVNARLTELMGPDDGSLPPGLQTLRRQIAGAEHTITANRWLSKPSVAPVLSGLADGTIPLTHQGLDELPRGQALDHLRQTLVAVGALPWRDEEMTRLEASLHGLLEAEADPERRRLLHRYLIWHLVRGIRSRNNGKPATRQQSLLTRRLARGAIAFLDWLDTAGLTLESLRQADLDQWLASGQAGYREEAGRLIRWASANRLTSCYLPAAARWTGPATALDSEGRWDTARRLLHDSTLKPEDRLAGLLVLLYAQNISAISRMTAAQVQARDDGTVRIQLGRAPVGLPEPAASIALAVAANRKGHATIGATGPSPWLFPGGQPGQPISSARLTERLEVLGISPRQARTTALFQLAAEVPAAILARTLGISTSVAVIWQRLSAGDYAAYAADVSRRPNQR
ncbi:MAG: hypothetical protein FWE35_28475 [Streptosporangiales bacterium]|nr:hypothetical protein [Streptosporangiales bacterium]